MLTYSHIPEMIKVLEEVRDRFWMLANSIDYTQQKDKPQKLFVCYLVKDVYFEWYSGDFRESVLDGALSYVRSELNYRSTFEFFVEHVMHVEIKINASHKLQKLFHITELKLQWLDYLILKLK